METKVTRISIAKHLQISRGALSDILNGKQPAGKRIASKFGELTGRNWIDFLIMTPAEIDEALQKAMRKNGA